jgi:hypothetical protein
MSKESQWVRRIRRIYENPCFNVYTPDAGRSRIISAEKARGR